VAYRAGADDTLVLIDPILPPNEQAFWAWLADGATHVTIVHGNRFHTRSTQAILDRVAGAVVWTPAAGAPPAGLVALPVEGLEDPETAWYIPEHRAIVFADAVLGPGGREVRIAPESWSGDAARYRGQFRASLRGVADRPIDLVLPSHADPVLANGGQALHAAIEGPAWEP
jgi:hypothetical protein